MKAVHWLFMLAAVVLGVVSGLAAPTSEPAKPAKVLLAVFAHPDDETVCAGVLARAAATGWEVRVIFATSGHHGSDVSGGNLKGVALGKEREREGACALTVLGVKRPPTFLGFGDSTLAQVRTQVTERLVKELAGLKADVILTFGPDGFTRHRDHITGGPGVGKTTLVNAILLVLRAKKVRLAVSRPGQGDPDREQLRQRRVQR